MAYPHPPPHLRITWKGVLGTNVPAPEEFTFGVSAAGDIGGGWLDYTVPTLEDLADEFVGDAAPLLPLMEPHVKITGCRVATIGDDGKTLRLPSGQYRHGDSVLASTGTGTAYRHPFQTAMAVSMRSLMAGPTGKGRFFLPGPAFGVEGETGLLSLANRTTIQNAVDAFLTNVNGTLAAQLASLRVVIASGGSPSRGLAPAVHTVTEVSVGRALDTIRSRRRSLDESKTWQAV